MTLSLTFKDGRVTGTGSDCVGDFVMRGTYDVHTGEVILHKHYRRYIAVFYKGFAERHLKGIWGTWEIETTDRGGFRIWPKKQGNDDESVECGEIDSPFEPVVDWESTTDLARIKLKYLYQETMLDGPLG